MALPRVDVLLPVLAARATLPDALADVLGQEDVDVRVLAVVDTPPNRDDGSRDWLLDRARHEPRLTVIDGPGRGAAAALHAGLLRAEAPWVSHMEADDRCPSERFRLLLERMATHPGLAGVTSRVEQFGATTPGMERYLRWQNGLVRGSDMARERFVEIPALHQTGLYRRSALVDLGGYVTRGPWPPDIDFWFRWFEAGLEVAKSPRVLYRWRQHEGQSTRVGRQHDQASLRAAKLDALARLHGERGRSPRTIRLLSTGDTLATWADGLAAAGLRVRAADAWRPGAPAPAVPRAGDLLLAVYGMPSVRDALRATLGHPSEPDELLFAA